MPDQSLALPPRLGDVTDDQLQDLHDRVSARLVAIHTADDGTTRDLTGDDRAEFDQLLGVVDRVRAERVIRTYQRRPAASSTWGMARGSDGNDIAPPQHVAGLSGRHARDAALRMLETHGRDLAPGSLDRVDATIRAELSTDQPNLDGEYVAKRLLITESPAYRSAWQNVMTNPHPHLTEDEVHAMRALRDLEVRNAASENTGSAGGYGVPVLIDPSIILSSGSEVAPVLNAARVIPITTNIWKGVSAGPVTFTFATEASVATDASPTLAQPTVTAHMAKSFIPYSIEVGQDYPSFASEMGRLLAEGWIDSIASKTISGSGSSQPWGILTRLDATTSAEVRVTTAGTVDATQIFSIWNSLGERFRARSKWLMSVSVESLIRSFSSANQSSAYFTVDLTADGLSRLNGRPNMVTDYMSTYVAGTTTSANYAIVGDFQHYVIAMRQGISVEPMPILVQQVTAGSGPAVPTGQRGFFAWGRWGADTTVTGAFKLLNQT